MTTSNLINDPTVFGTTALAILLDKFGTECLEWDPTTLSLEMKGAFGSEPEDEVFDRIMAAINMLTSNNFMVDVHAFMATCNTLNFGVTMSGLWVPADLDDVLWGVTEARLLLGDEFNEDDISHDVKRYVGVLLQQEGVKDIPRVLAFAEIDEDVTKTYEEYDGDEIFNEVFTEDSQEEVEDLEVSNKKQLSSLMKQLSQLPIQSEFIESLKR